MMPPTPAMTLEIMKTRMRMRCDVDAGAPGSLGVAADGVDVAAERRPLREVRQADEEDDHQQAGERKADALPSGRCAWLQIATEPNAATATPTTLASARTGVPVATPARRRPTTPPSADDRVSPGDDRGDDPADGGGEEVVGEVVDQVVLDDDHPAILEHVQDHALPDQQARRA